MSELQRSTLAGLATALKASIPADIQGEDRQLAEAVVAAALQVVSDFNRIADALEQLARR